MKPLISLSLSCLLLGLAACSKGDSNPPPSDSNSIATTSLEESQRLADAAIAHCPDPSQCSPSVAMLVGTTETSAYQCTAFLVSDLIMATNSHCIPDDLKLPNTSCRGRVSLIFPELNNYPQEKIECDQILSASTIHDDNKSHADYAFLKLSKASARPKLSLTREGFVADKSYTVQKMDPYQGNGIPEAYLRSEKCLALAGSSVIDPRAKNIVALGDCIVIHGNSGSPLLNERGEVPGIVFALPELNLGELKDIHLKENTIAPLAVATNYSCLELPLPIPYAAGGACQEQLNIDESALEKRITMDILRSFHKVEPTLDPRFRWTPVPIRGPLQEALIIPVPECLKERNRYLKNQSIYLDFWLLDKEYNRYLQPDYQLQQKSMRIRFEFYENSWQHKAGFSLYNNSLRPDSSSFYSGELPPCD